MQRVSIACMFIVMLLMFILYYIYIGRISLDCCIFLLSGSVSGGVANSLDTTVANVDLMGVFPPASLKLDISPMVVSRESGAGTNLQKQMMQQVAMTTVYLYSLYNMY